METFPIIPSNTEVQPENESETYTQGEPPRRRSTRHARARKAEGRPVGTAFNDARKARAHDVFVQPDGRYVVRAPRGREHILGADGTHITTVQRGRSAHKIKLMRTERRPIAHEEFEQFKEIFQ